MPFEAIGTFFTENVGSFSFDFDVGSLVDDFGTEFLTDIQSTFTDFNIPSFEIPSLGGWDQVGSFSGSADWFDTFNVGSILDSVPSIGDFNLSSLTDNLPSLSSITDSAKAIGDSISTGFQSIKDALPSLDKIKTTASTFSKDIGELAKTGQKALSAYQKVAPAVNAASNALGIQNPINQIIQPLQTAVGIGGAAAGIAGGVSSGISGGQSFGQKVSDFFGTSPTQAAETYNQAVRTVSSTDEALKTYDADKATYTSDILRTSDNISAIQSKLDDPEISEEERQIAQDQLKGEYDKLSVAQRSLEQTNTVIDQVTTARNSAAQIVASTDLKSIKAPYTVDSSGLVILDAKQTAELEKNLNPAFVNSLTDPATAKQKETYNQAKATVESTNAALKQFDAEKTAYTSDIVKTSDNIYNINQRLDDPNTSPEERALLEEQLTNEYVRLSETQKALEQTNFAAEQVTAARDSAAQIIAADNANALQGPVSLFDAAATQFKTAYDSLTKTFSIFDSRTGQTVSSGLSEQQALTATNAFNITSGINLATQTTTDADPFEVARQAAAAAFNIPGPTEADVLAASNAQTAALTAQARAQQSVRALRNNKAQGSDWRVRLKLAPNSTYLYNDTQPGILTALKNTDGVIFPYTPSIDTAYKANYDQYDLTHSNYRGYFYKGSHVDAVNIRAQFTAQDTKEADYLLAVIHFFRSCTKMFYGQDVQRGSPPPLVYLNGYGDYQFNEHPCVVSQFNYTLPPDVDYIRAQSTLSANTNQLNSRLRNPIANNPLAYSVNRLLNSKLLPGALDFRPTTPGAGNLATGTPTYVPTKMEISITLLPIQSRAQISNNFSVKEFANGNLLKGGYW